jgi:FKBP-type peptidyl-prolyl cis-trans isomerase FkpA
MSKKSALARKREAQEARRRRNRRLRAIGIGTAVVVIVAAIAVIAYFALHKDPLVIEDLVVGTGAEAQVGDSVTVHYTGWLKDGTQFDSSIDTDQPYEFTLGQGRVIKGWDKGIKGMRVGGTRRLIIPPHLAYGEKGNLPDIPPNATLTFEVQLLAVE